MGQYWLVVNLDKREFIHPHKLGCGLKLREQIAAHPSTGTALLILCAAMPERRGGGDLEENPIVGRWAGDRIALVGDYAEKEDLPARFAAQDIYDLCHSDEDVKSSIEYHEERLRDMVDQNARKEVRAKIRALKEKKLFTDITDQVCKIIEKELGGRFSGEGWRDFIYNGENDKKACKAMRPDIVVMQAGNSKE